MIEVEEIVKNTKPALPYNVTALSAPVAAGAAQATTSSPSAAAIKVSTVDDLKAKAPEVHRTLEESIIQHIIRQQEQHNQRLKRAIREGRT